MARRRDSRWTRGAALFFAGSHAALSLAALHRPGVYGFPLGEAGHGGRIRILAMLDLPPALAVAHAAATSRPLRRKLQVGAASDLLRAALIMAWFRDAPRPGRVALVAASLSGATLATYLGRHADRSSRALRGRTAGSEPGGHE